MIMRVVDNFKQIRDILKFEDKDDFYFLQIIQRKKDGNNVPSANNGYRAIKSYYITSKEDFDRRMPAIVQLCKQNNARAYINLNVRNAKEVALQCSKAYIDIVLEDRASQGHRVYDHCCGITPKKGVKRTWIVDVDSKDPKVVNAVYDAINHCKSGSKIDADKYNNVLHMVPTLNGFHLITVGFDKSQLLRFLIPNRESYGIDEETLSEICNSVKKDNPTLLYFEDKQNDENNEA